MLLIYILYIIYSGLVGVFDAAVPNRVKVKLEDKKMDESMNASDATIQGIINIEDFLNSNLVTENPNQVPYCTSLSIELPKNQEVTPIEMTGVAVGNSETINDELPTEGKVLPFLNFQEKQTTDIVQLEPGDAMVCVNDDTDNMEAPGYITGVVQNKSLNSIYNVGFFEKTKTAILKATEMAGYVGKLACGVYDAYSKIKMFLPITSVTSLIPLEVDGQTVGAFAVGNDAKTDGNQVFLMKNTFDLVGI